MFCTFQKKSHKTHCPSLKMLLASVVGRGEKMIWTMRMFIISFNKKIQRDVVWGLICQHVSLATHLVSVHSYWKTNATIYKVDRSIPPRHQSPCHSSTLYEWYYICIQAVLFQGALNYTYIISNTYYDSNAG